MEERIYSAQGSGSPVAHFRILRRTFSSAHSLGFRLAERNIRARYRQSIFGLAWAFLPPLATALIWILLRKASVVDMGDVGYPYPAFVITGTLIWSVFTAAVNSPIASMNNNRSILVKLNFPREALIITAFYEVLFTALIATVIIVVELLVFRVPVGFTTLLYFPCIVALILLGMSLGLLLLPFSMLYKDLQFILPSVLQFAMYLTPVVYAQPVYSGAASILQLNPVTPILTGARSFLLGGPVQPELFWQIGIVTGIALVLFVIGLLIQRVAISILVERMGS
jgi:lipopolysaccharide transport system permease protein